MRRIASAFAALILVPLAVAAPTVPALAQDTACAVPLGSAESPSFTPVQQEYRARLHSLATGKGIKVAIIDTGVSAHEQFPQLEAGPDLVVPDEPTPFHDCDIHGTVVASVIGARDMGIAPDATLMAIRQSSLHYRSTPDSESSGSLATMAESVHAAVDAGARVISLSVVSCMTKQQAENLDSHGLTEALDRAERAGVVVLASAGNVDGDCEPGMVVYPAIEDSVITVAALSTEYELADYSLPVVDGEWVSAPGAVNIAVHPNGTGWMRGAIKNGSEGGFNGTSYATPTVSGTVALMLERNPNLSPSQVREIIYDAAQSTNRVHDPLAALSHVPATYAVEERAVEVTPAPAAGFAAQGRLWKFMAVVAGVGIIALFIAGMISSLRPRRSPASEQLPRAAISRSATPLPARRRPKHQPGRHRGAHGGGRWTQ